MNQITSLQQCLEQGTTASQLLSIARWHEHAAQHAANSGQHQRHESLAEQLRSRAHALGSLRRHMESEK